MVDLATGLGQGMEQLVNAVESLLFPFFYVILGGTSELLFERILFLAIIFAIVYVVISNMDLFKGNNAVIIIVTVCVSLLSTRFLVGEGLLKAMILPYSTLGVVLGASLPLLIFFFFVESFKGGGNSTLRKMLWIFYIITFIVIWSSRYDDVGKLSWLYFFSAGAAFLFLLFDGTIQSAIMRNERRLLGVNNKEQHLAEARRQLRELRENKDDYSPSAFKNIEREKIKWIQKLEKSKF